MSENTARSNGSGSDHEGPEPLDPTGAGDDESAGVSADFILASRPGEYPSTWPEADGPEPAHHPTMPGAVAPAPGRRLPVIPGYEILGELGRGGMGVVYMARRIRLNRPCAVKMILAGAHASDETNARFLAEAETVARLRHPNVVQIYHIGEAEGLLFVELEYVRGGSLDKRLDGSPWAAGRAALLVKVLAEVLAEVHRLGIVHRDLKPANVLLEEDGTPKLTDFGLVKALDAESGLTRTGLVLGTPSYMAPEQAEGRNKHVGPAADLYALGAILYELLVGRPPLRGASAAETLEQVRKAEPVPPSRLVPGLPRDLETICLKCLRKEPSRRYASAEALAEDLGAFLGDRPIQARRAAGPELAVRWCRRNPRVAASLVATVGMVVVTIASLGASLAVMRSERNKTLRLLNRTELAEVDAREKLWGASLAHARAGRWSGRPGRRFDGLRALAEAARLHPTREVRDEAVACLALLDIRPERRLHILTHESMALAFDADLTRYALGDHTGDVRVRRVDDDREEADLRGADRHAFILRFGPDGRSLVSVHHGDEVRLWDVASGRALLAFPGCQGVSFHPDGRRVALGRRDDTIGIYDTRTGELLKRLAVERRCHILEYRPDGAVLAFSDGERPGVELCDAETGRVTEVVSAPGGVTALAWGASGQLLAVAGADHRIRISDFAPGGVEAVLEDEAMEMPNSLCFSPDGRLLASNGWDETLRLWDAATGRRMLTVPGALGALRFSADGRRLGGTRDGRDVEIWEVGGGAEYQIIRDGSDCRSLAYSPDGRWLATTSGDGVRLRDRRTLRQLALLPYLDCHAVQFDPADGSLLTCGGFGVRRRRIDPDPEVRGGFRIGPAEAIRPPSVYWHVDVTPDGHLMALADREHRQALVTDPGGRARATVGVPNVAHVALSPDGRWLATGTHFESGPGLRVWEARSGRLAWTLPGKGNARGAFDPGGRWLLSSTGDEFRYWRVGTWAPGPVLRRSRGGVPGPLAFDAAGSLLALAIGPREVSLVDAATGSPLTTLPAPDEERITDLGFDPVEGRLAATVGNRFLQVWDLRIIRARLSELGVDWSPNASPTSPAHVDATEITSVRVEDPPWTESLSRGDRLARGGRWTDAVAAFADAVVGGTDHPDAWYWLALAELRRGELDGYRRACEDMLGRTVLSHHRSSAHLVAWTCTLGPEAVSDREAPVRLAESALASSPEMETRTMLNTLGAALYRAGRPEEAIVRLEESVHQGGPDAYNLAFLAMAHHQLGHREEARRNLRRTADASISLRPDDPFWNRLCAEVLRREAEALLGAPASELPADVFTH